MSGEEITQETVRKVARLARLAIDDERAARYAEQLGRIVGYVERLSELDLDGVEPLTHPIASSNRLEADEAGGTLSRETLEAMAPDSVDGFVRVPKVLDTGSAGG